MPIFVPTPPYSQHLSPMQYFPAHLVTIEQCGSEAISQRSFSPPNLCQQSWQSPLVRVFVPGNFDNLEKNSEILTVQKK